MLDFLPLFAGANFSLQHMLLSKVPPAPPLALLSATLNQKIWLARSLRGYRLVDQANEMFRVLPIALTRDRIGVIRAFRQTFVAFVILSPLAEAVG